MTRRLVGLLVAVVLLLTGARAHCLFSCGGPAPTAASPSCHDEPAAGLAISAAHSCAGDVLTPAPAITRAGADLAFAGLPAIVTIPLISPPASIEHRGIPTSSADPPRPPALVPLRI